MVPALFVFGDSIMDVGNNNDLPLSVARAILPYYGVDFPTKKPNGRFSNGKNSADFIAEKLGLPTSPPYLISNSSQSNSSSPFLTGVSFASGGAGIFDGTDEKLQQSIPLKDQVELYRGVHDDLVQHMGSSGAQKHVAKSLFLIGIGSNDIFDYVKSSDLRKQHTPQQYVDLMVSSLKGSLKGTYIPLKSALITAMFCVNLVLWLPKVAFPDFFFFFFSFSFRETLNSRGSVSTVTMRASSCSRGSRRSDALRHRGLGTRTHRASATRTRIPGVACITRRSLAMMKGLKSELGDISYSYLDIYNVVLGFIQNPSAYGFTEVKTACCGLGDLRAQIPCLPISQLCSNRRDHVFWDLVHPTEATDRMLIDIVFRGSPQYTYPMGVQQLAAVET
ncbi:hypothetical protein EUGRSUZ_F00745 [Eucalyptus grandis]|uniref:Uncharacterized protein n=2 Tax=Eucalyptus grandis TaxID=71139 RepID=A0ACC3KCI7_EUCGR|nr:hypothetical protein EUGRSUZ_F00745 [Eucalyptus grandis]